MLVLPEALNYVLSEDESMLEVLELVTSFSLTSYPELSIQTALAQLGTDLRQCALKVERREGGREGGGEGGGEQARQCSFARHK